MFDVLENNSVEIDEHFESAHMSKNFSTLTRKPKFLPKLPRKSKKLPRNTSNQKKLSGIPLGIHLAGPVAQQNGQLRE